MQAVIPGEGRHERMERFRSHFSRRRFPPFGSPSGRIPMAEAAERLHIHQQALESILARCKARSKGRGGVELPYDFKAMPVWLERGQIQGGVLSGEGFHIISEYLRLRSMVRGNLLLPVSSALVSNPAITSRSRRQIEVLDNFVLSRIKFPGPMPPLLMLSAVGYGLQAPVREYKDSFYSFADYLGPIVFAAKMQSPSPLTQFAEIGRLKDEAARANSPEEISVSLGMRLWIMRELFADPDYEVAFCQRNLRLMEKILSDPVVQDFFAKSYNAYVDPRIDAEESGFKEGRVSRRIFPSPAEKT